MALTDPIADMLTRIRNANQAKHETVDIPASKFKIKLAEILLEEGYIKNFELIEEGVQGTIRVELKYNADRRVITGIRRISKPGLRVYVNKDEVPRVLGGLGTAVLTTSSGVMTDKHARKLGVGGEVICYVW
ncbi:MAG: 30S ribosomal protein S8 [Bacillota bacterium]|nr:30S ribosomal protein S8 [Bacillota bacterium]